MPNAFKGLFLAAGVGSRLMPLTADRPKALLELGGETLLDRLMDQCFARGMTEAVVVVGHARSAVEHWRDARERPFPIHLVYNAEYAALNNAHSVYVARAALAGQTFVKFDGDIILDGAVLDRLLASPHPSTIALDSQAKLDAEAMKARCDSRGFVLALGKWIPVAGAAGESIGVERISSEDSEPLFDAIHHAVHVEGRGHMYYEDVYHRMVDDGWRLGAADVGGLGWAEIDNAADLERAHSLIRSLNK